MPGMKTSPLIGFVSALAMLGSAQADESFRCGKWVVTSSASVSELLEKCGQPMNLQSKTEDIMVRNVNTGLMMKTGETVTETWTFDRGTQAAAMVATIVDGRLKSLERKQ
jgi:hypothetical protein